VILPLQALRPASAPTIIPIPWNINLLLEGAKKSGSKAPTVVCKGVSFFFLIGTLPQEEANGSCLSFSSLIILELVLLCVLLLCSFVVGVSIEIKSLNPSNPLGPPTPRPYTPPPYPLPFLCISSLSNASLPSFRHLPVPLPLT